MLTPISVSQGDSWTNNTTALQADFDKVSITNTLIPKPDCRIYSDCLWYCHFLEDHRLVILFLLIFFWRDGEQGVQGVVIHNDARI